MNLESRPQTSARRASRTVTVVLVDDQPAAREVVRDALLGSGLLVLAEASSARAGVQAVLDHKPEVVLIDPGLAGDGAPEAIKRITRLAPDSRVLALTSTTDQSTLLAAVNAGASGLVLKQAGGDEIVEGVRACAAGECVLSPELAAQLLLHLRDGDGRPRVGRTRAAEAIRASLTKRELQIFGLLASGESNREIAEGLLLSESTVKNHVASILAKLRLRNRAEAAAHAARTGFSGFTGIAIAHALTAEASPAQALLGWVLGTA